MVLSALLLLVGFAGCGITVYFFHRELQDWKARYKELEAESRIRESRLFDQLCIKQQVAPPSRDHMVPVHRASISDEDREILTDRINERIEAGMMTASQGNELLQSAVSGERTQSEIDRDLWLSHSVLPKGSVYEEF